MAKLVYTNAFIEDMTAVQLASKRDGIFNRIDLLADFPDLGSTKIPKSIRLQFGDSVRKLVVSPFDIVYEHDRGSDIVRILCLIHERAAY